MPAARPGGTCQNRIEDVGFLGNDGGAGESGDVCRLLGEGAALSAARQMYFERIPLGCALLIVQLSRESFATRCAIRGTYSRLPGPWGSPRPVSYPSRVGDTRSRDAYITALALAAGAGGHDALVAFIRATQSDIYRFLGHLSGSEEAEDLTQETYLRALRALPHFAGRSCARTWLLSIARRVAADRVRQLMTRPRTTVVTDWDAVLARSPTHRRSAFDEGVVLRELVAALEPGRRDAFVLTQVLGLDYAAAAEVCGCPIGTIRSRVARARRDLVRAMNAAGLPDHSATAP
jgi:RNA polymerase sigma-70 factor, ECF subfamily